MTQSPPRLYIDAALRAGESVGANDAQSHYLLTVMRRGQGDEVWLFNGQDGEWRARIEAHAKRRCVLVPIERRRIQSDVLDLWLIFAPVKNARTEILVEKATELGVTRLVPVLTERTILRRLNHDRLRAHAVEAAEQSNRLDVPAVEALKSLDDVLEAWPKGRRMIYADEIGPAPFAANRLRELNEMPSAVLIGPEGGFSLAERTRILELPEVVPVSLGKRLLRADTAAVAALVLVQAAYGERAETA